MIQYFDNDTLIDFPPKIEDYDNKEKHDKVCKMKTKLVSGTKIDIAKANKELILLDTGANDNKIILVYTKVNYDKHDIAATKPQGLPRKKLLVPWPIA